MRKIRALSLILVAVAATGPAFAQPAPAGASKPGATSAARKPPKGVEPEAAPLAEKIAGPFTLTSADGSRHCPFTLKAEPAPAFGFATQFDRAVCAPIAFAGEVAGWVPDASGAIRLVSAQGRTLAEFTEGTGGDYEALREDDGVYFLTNPAAAEGTEVRPEEMIGEWDLARIAGTIICHWTLSDVPAPAGGFLVRVAPGCDSAVAQFNAARWTTEGGNVLVFSASGATTLRFARQEDGGWAKVPEQGRPLLLLRQ